MSVAEIEAAAKTLGLTTITVPSIAATGVMGKYLASIGVKQYAHGLFLHSTDHMVGAIAKINEELSKTTDPDVRFKFLELQHKYTRTLAETAEAMVDTGDIKPSERKDRPRLEAPEVPPAPTVIAIQNTVNVGGDQVSVERPGNERSVGQQP